MAGGHTDWVFSVSFSPDGSLLASGSWDRTVKLWRVSDGALLRTYDQETGTGVLSIQFSPSGRLFGYGRADATVVVARNPFDWGNTPFSPANLRAFAISSSQIQLDWNDTSTGELGFEIERMTGNQHYTLVARVGPNVTTYTDSGLTAETTYTYRVRAYYTSKKSPYSNPARATTCSGGRFLYTSLRMYRANLHSHSTYSDGRWSLTERNDLPPRWVFTWGYTKGWDIWAVTDHAEQISGQEWEDTERDAQSIMRMSPTFTALRGFEWTGYTADLFDPYNSLDIGGGHINVFGSGERKGAYDASDGDRYPIQAQDVLGSLSLLYSWLASTNAVDGGTLVAQFNHPTTYDQSSHFEYFYFLVPSPLANSVNNVFALMEVGSHTSPWESFFYEGGEENLLTGQPDDQARSNEYWWRVALSRGWHVAPTNNRDNHLYHELGSPPGPPAFTGIWAPSSLGNGENSPEERTSMILNALRARRVFASEDWNTRLALQVRIKRGNTSQQGWYWMGSTFEMPTDADALQINIWVEKTDANHKDYIQSVELFISPPWYASEADNPPQRFYSCSEGTYLVAEIFDLPKSLLQGQRRNALNEVYMYIRVRTSRGRFLYSAPIWIRGLPRGLPKPPNTPSYD
jgi:hypothetical protein